MVPNFKSALETEMLVILEFEVLLMIINNKFLTRAASWVRTRTRLLNSGMLRLRMNTAHKQAQEPGHCLTNKFMNVLIQYYKLFSLFFY